MARFVVVYRYIGGLILPIYRRVNLKVDIRATYNNIKFGTAKIFISWI